MLTRRQLGNSLIGADVRGTLTSAVIIDATPINGFRTTPESSKTYKNATIHAWLETGTTEQYTR